MSIHESPGTSTDRLGHRLLQLGMLPIAAPGRIGAPWQETAIAVLLVALSLAIVAASALVLWGLRLAKQGPSS